MPYCPDCKYEYERNIEYCSDCGAKLVDELEKEPHPEYDKEVFLANVSDEIQASIIISKLSLYDIPVLKKYKESGSFMAVYMGNTLFGIDLYVPSKLLSKAREVLSDDGLTDADGLEFDRMMDEYGFEDIDNFEFENEDEAFREEETKEIHLVNKNPNAPASQDSPDDSYKNSSSDFEDFFNTNNISDVQNKRNKKVRFMQITVILLIFVPLIISTLFALVRLLLR